MDKPIWSLRGDYHRGTGIHTWWNDFLGKRLLCSWLSQSMGWSRALHAHVWGLACGCLGFFKALDDHEKHVNAIVQKCLILSRE